MMYVAEFIIARFMNQVYRTNTRYTVIQSPTMEKLATPSHMAPYAASGLSLGQFNAMIGFVCLAQRDENSPVNYVLRKT
jgi:hypothetical protein